MDIRSLVGSWVSYVCSFYSVLEGLRCVARRLALVKGVSSNSFGISLSRRIVYWRLLDLPFSKARVGVDD